jgi:hypothetical protein
MASTYGQGYDPRFKTNPNQPNDNYATGFRQPALAASAELMPAAPVSFPTREQTRRPVGYGGRLGLDNDADRLGTTRRSARGQAARSLLG